MRLFAFAGLRYTPRAGNAGNAGDIGELAAPPYDQINEAARDRFHAASPYQFAHLTRPVAPEGGDIYRSAADLHARWLRDGIVARDGRPALYPYVIELAGGGERLGVLGLAELADPSVIRPHEQTLDKPLADRLALLSAMRVDLEPVLLLSADGGRLDALLHEDLAGRQPLVPLVRHRDADGNFHVLYRLDDPDRIALYRRALDVPAAIADGHHRYKVAQRYAEERGIRPGTAASAKLAVVTSLDSPALAIEPIHRAFRAAIDLDRIAGLADAAVRFSGVGGRAFAAAVGGAEQPALGIWMPPDRDPEIWHFKGGPQPAVKIFQDAILPALGYTAAAATDGTVIYRSSPDELWDQVAAGELGTGIFLPPMAPAEFAAAIAHGELLPPKSTRFMPKVMSGLVWADHDSPMV